MTASRSQQPSLSTPLALKIGSLDSRSMIWLPYHCRPRVLQRQDRSRVWGGASAERCRAAKGAARGHADIPGGDRLHRRTVRPVPRHHRRGSVRGPVSFAAAAILLTTASSMIGAVKLIAVHRAATSQQCTAPTSLVRTGGAPPTSTPSTARSRTIHGSHMVRPPGQSISPAGVLVQTPPNTTQSLTFF